jgi:DNA-binding CsgD family transcriptional regulator/PAS domain-containing protein
MDGLATVQDGIGRLVATIHQGVLEDPRWSGFLATLQSMTGASYASLVFRRADPRFRELHVLRTDGGVFADATAEHRTLIGKVRPLYDRVVPDRPYALAEIAALAGQSGQGYLAYLGSRGLRDVLCLRVDEPHGGHCWLSLARSRGDFAPEAKLWLRDLAPHLATAAHTLAVIEAERMRADIATDAMKRLHFGWLTFDAESRIVEVDPEAERLLGTVSGFPKVVRGEPLGGSARRRLADAITALSEQPCPRSRVVHLADVPWLDMLMAPVAFRPVSVGRAPVAVGYVHGVDGASADRQEQLVQMFRLTPSEARLALAMSQGRSIAEAAEALGLSRETARSYSKRIYAKTGTRGQADLVRIILAGVLALA